MMNSKQHPFTPKSISKPVNTDYHMAISEEFIPKLIVLRGNLENNLELKGVYKA